MCSGLHRATPYGARSALREAAGRAGVRVSDVRSNRHPIGPGAVEDLSRLRVLWPGRRRAAVRANAGLR
eukprot:1127310-Prymnesium_polylepis.1